MKPMTARYYGWFLFAAMLDSFKYHEHLPAIVDTVLFLAIWYMARAAWRSTE